MLTVNQKSNNNSQQDNSSQYQNFSMNEQSAYRTKSIKQTLYNQKDTHTSRTSNQQKIKQSKTYKRIKLDKQSRSRSRSNSSYCEAGCLRGSSINKKMQYQPKKKIEKIERVDKLQKNNNNCGQQKLFGAIQKFYTNLSTMPLDLLITHTNPEQWLSQQYETCRQLNKKLCKLQSQRKNRSHTQIQVQNKTLLKLQNKQNLSIMNITNKVNCNTTEYYKTKLTAVQGILNNIENNIQMLLQLHQQQLRSYNSNSSFGSSVNNSGIKNMDSIESSPSVSSKIKLIDLVNNQKMQLMNPSINTFSHSQSVVNKNKKQKNSPKNIKNTYKKQQSTYQIKEDINNTYQASICSSQINNHYHNNFKQTKTNDKYNGNKNYNQLKQNNSNEQQKKDSMWDKFYENLKKLTKNQLANKQNKFGQKYQGENLSKQIDYQAHFLSTCRSQQSPSISEQKPRKYLSGQTRQNTREESQNKQKTIKHGKKQIISQQNGNKKFTKFQLSSPEEQKDVKYEASTIKQSQNQVKNAGKIQSISQFFVKSLLHENKNTQTLKNLFQQIMQGSSQRASQQEQAAQKYNKIGVSKYCYQSGPSSTTSSRIVPSTLKPLVNQITSLKQQLSQKNKIIQHLLSSQQQHEHIVQLYKESQHKHKQSHTYSIQRINNLQNTITKYQKQIKKYENIDIQLRESIKLQIISNDSLQQDKRRLQQMLQNQRNKHKVQTNQLKYQIQIYQNQTKNLKKLQNISKQKMQIYKQKYYQLLHQGQLKKMIQNNTYTGKATKVKQIRNILNQHRKNLINLDQYSQQQQEQSNKNTITKRYNQNSDTPNYSHLQDQQSYYTQQIEPIQKYKQSPHQKKIHNKLTNRFIENQYQSESSGLKYNVEKVHKINRKLNHRLEESQDSDS